MFLTWHFFGRLVVIGLMKWLLHVLFREGLLSVVGLLGLAVIFFGQLLWWLSLW